MKNFYFLTVAILLLHTVHAQHTAIPDQNFEQALIDLGLDDVIDGQVLTANIINVIELDIPGLGIQDLTGIEDFSSLLVLWGEDNTISSLDISQNFALELLVIDNNPLTNIDITNNLNLWAFSASDSFLTTLDTNMNLDLEILRIGDSNITSLDLSNNSNLALLSAGGNQLTEIDLSSNILLEELYLCENLLTSINLENQANLLDLYIDFNLLTELDLSNNPNVEQLDCSFNPFLSFINIKNGNNGILDEFNAVEIANNACIQVDDAAAATTASTFPYNLWEVDPTSIFSENCSLSTEPFTILDIKTYPNPTTDLLYVITNESLTYSIFSIDGRIIQQTKPLMENKITLFHLNAGVYMIQFQNTTNLNKTLKINKK
jgi:hypothetical protein